MESTFEEIQREGERGWKETLRLRSAEANTSRDFTTTPQARTLWGML